MRNQKATKDHEDFNHAMIGVMAQFKDRLSPIEMLAVASHFVGALLAAQDQTKVTPAMAMDMVAANIQAGNEHAINSIMRSEGTA